MWRQLPRTGFRTVVLVSLAALIASCGSGEQVVTGTNIVARAKECSDSSPGPGGGAALTGSAWRAGTLVVDATEVVACGMQLLRPSFAVAADELALDWAWGMSGGGVAACRCTYALQFEVTGLEQRQYTIRVPKRQ
ncbi:MAG: hypothetical protein JNM90_06150 [Burkholderiales bacterium]|nr:hypothetical protein [Burkholderiales bacterium]